MITFTVSDLQKITAEAIASAQRQLPAWLGPVAKAVWDACANFNPTFDYWSRQEGDQRDSYSVEGINIVVHW